MPFIINSLVLLASLFFYSQVVSASNNTNNKNALYQHASAYLAMHGQDPVNWLDWQQSTLAKAKDKNKIMMISSGYFSCHWCHVMQKENYHDPKAAAYLNKHFISVKIDRELTPDLDRYLIDFAKKSAGHAGWPQHVFLTPNGYPFFAFTYKPNPQFLQTLTKVQNFWEKSANKVIATARSTIIPANTTATHPLSAQDFNQALSQQLLNQMDSLEGGLKGANKFPNAPILKTVLLQKNQNEEITDWIKLTLNQIQSEHLFDHIYGGFYRYTIDPAWQTPHFEKMLYTQAQLAEIYYIASQKYRRDDYLATANRTLAYVEQQLYHPATGLYQSSQSAVDKNLTEAADYVWTEAQLKQTLNQNEFDQVKQEWLSQPTEYEIPIKGNLTTAWHPRPTTKHWQSIQAKLANSDIKPATNIPTDSKSILGWNGLLLTAFTKAVELKQRPAELADKLAHALLTNINKKNPPRALSANNQKMGRANIQDYAYIIQGLTNWSNLRKNNPLTLQIANLKQQAKTKFLTKQGWLYSDSPILPNQSGTRAMEDGPIPSPTAILDCLLIKRLESSPLSYASYAQENCY